MRYTAILRYLLTGWIILWVVVCADTCGATLTVSNEPRAIFIDHTCETIVASDINGDCIVDFKDFATMASHWLERH